MSRNGHRIARLGDVADFIRGITFKPEDLLDPDAPGAVVCMRTKNVQEDLDQDDRLAVPPQFVRGAEKYLREGDVLVSTANSYDLVGKSCWVPRLDYPATAGGFISIFRPDREALDPRYFYWWMTSDHTRLLLRRCGRRTTNISNMDMHRAAALEIPLPPLSEQRRVAAVLDRADALRRRRREAMRESQALVDATFLDLFGHPERNEKGFPLRPLGDLAENEDGKRVPVKLADRAERKGEFPYYGASGIIDYVDDFLFEGERLLIAEDGANLLSRSLPIAFIARGRFWVNNHAHVVKDNGKCCLIYLEAALNALNVEAYVTGSAQPKLNQAQLNRILLPVPSRDVQEKFKAVVKRVQIARTRMDASAASAEALAQAIADQSFLGDSHA